jgi:hypothetical protein
MRGKPGTRPAWLVLADAVDAGRLVPNCNYRYAEIKEAMGQCKGGQMEPLQYHLAEVRSQYRIRTIGPNLYRLEYRAICTNS